MLLQSVKLVHLGRRSPVQWLIQFWFALYSHCQHHSNSSTIYAASASWSWATECQWSAWSPESYGAMHACHMDHSSRDSSRSTDRCERTFWCPERAHNKVSWSTCPSFALEHRTDHELCQMARKGRVWAKLHITELEIASISSRSWSLLVCNAILWKKLKASGHWLPPPQHSRQAAADKWVAQNFWSPRIPVLGPPCQPYALFTPWNPHFMEVVSLQMKEHALAWPYFQVLRIFWKNFYETCSEDLSELQELLFP